MNQAATGYEVSRDEVGNQVLSFRENRSSSTWKGVAFTLLAMFVFIPGACVAGHKALGGYTFFLLIAVGVMSGVLGKAIGNAKKPATVKLTRGSLFTTSGQELFFDKIVGIEVAKTPKHSALKANYQGSEIFITHNLDTLLAEALYSPIQTWILNNR